MPSSVAPSPAVINPSLRKSSPLPHSLSAARHLPFRSFRAISRRDLAVGVSAATVLVAAMWSSGPTPSRGEVLTAGATFGDPIFRTNRIADVTGDLQKVEGKSIYTVVRGDTLTAIGQRFGTTVEILMEANELKSDLVVPGQQLWVPRTYQIQKGDTLYRLAQEYGTTMEEILKINRITDPNVIRAGDIMLLP